ncbi:hypothetical protein [Niabella aurantiaca]|uniref:hypothetical protein n=1 Tax=Niabella aurantiaca TaxID=379900 RepID=UPI00035FC19C|nr:hypothetical protein [Niabella aurantiaca]
MSVIYKIWALLAVFCLSKQTLLSQNDVYLLEAESFQFKGKWITERDKNCLNGSLLKCIGGENDRLLDALSVLTIKETGTYTVWMRTPDFADRPSTRQIQLSVGSQLMDRAGKHGKTGFYWERVGSVNLRQKEILLRLHNFNYGRCDAVLLTKDAAVDPNSLSLVQLAKWRKKPAAQPVYADTPDRSSAYLPVTGKDTVVASIEKHNIRLAFVKAAAAKNAIACRTEVKVNGQWRRFPGGLEDHKIFLLYADSTSLSFSKYFPSWNSKKRQSYFVFDGARQPVVADGDDLDPFKAADLSEAIPVAVQQADKETIAVHYVTRNHSAITGYWTVSEKGYHLNVRLVCKTARAGYYSMAVAAFRPVAEADLGNVMLPPMYQYKRVPPKPQMLTSSMMQQPLAITEALLNDQKWAVFISGGNAILPKDWGTAANATIGFSIKNQKNEIQPVAFAPVLGMKDSWYAANGYIDKSFTLGLMAAGWEPALTYISDSVFKVTDYRRQTQVSLTNTVFNMIDLINNDAYGGWSAKLKGFYDIEGNPETAPTVVNATPLVTMSLAALTNSEQLYLTRALPVIEYTLSRSGYRWATDIVPTAYNNTLKTLELNPFRSQFTTSYYAGLDRLLGGLNPWLKEIALPGDHLRQATGYSTKFIPWIAALSAYKLTGATRWLDSAKTGADQFIRQQVYVNTKTPLSPTPFYNASFYGPWWNLLDLYEITKDKKYLDAAAYGSFFTIAGVRSYPAVKDSLMVIHPAGRFDGNDRIWWKGKQQYRLGFPRVQDDAREKKVPGWLVSPVGLGFEQPSTYYLTAKGKNVRPVFMSSWAPHLLRLFQYTKNKIHETYARNAVIGRFTNYPGYYATGFTDITMQPDFPYKGPDVSSIYYHHIPPHLAFSLDYLITEMIQRANGNVAFPYSNQEGFVWFANRIYGGGKGMIFGDKEASLWLKKGLIEIQNPAINYVTAVSKDRLWILVSSEAQKDERITIGWNANAGTAAKGPCAIYDAQNVREDLSFENYRVSTTVPAKGFRAISVPLAASRPNTGYTALKQGMQVVDAGAPWGKVFLFRIRSPFGWDSVYGFAETSPLNGAEVRISCNGQMQTIPAYPYEWSFYKIKMEDAANISITLKDAQGKIKTEKIVLDGN